MAAGWRSRKWFQFVIVALAAVATVIVWLRRLVIHNERKEDEMADETEVLEDEVIDIEEQEDEPTAPLDLSALERDAKTRTTLMAERGRSPENIANTFAGWVEQLMAQNAQALSEAIRAEAEQRKAILDAATASEPYKRKALCSKVMSGAFDA